MAHDCGVGLQRDELGLLIRLEQACGHERRLHSMRFCIEHAWLLDHLLFAASSLNVQLRRRCACVARDGAPRKSCSTILIGQRSMAVDCWPTRSMQHDSIHHKCTGQHAYARNVGNPAASVQQHWPALRNQGQVLFDSAQRAHNKCQRPLCQVRLAQTHMVARDAECCTGWAARLARFRRRHTRQNACALARRGRPLDLAVRSGQPFFKCSSGT